MLNEKVNNIKDPQLNDHMTYKDMLETTYKYTDNCVLQEIN